MPHIIHNTSNGPINFGPVFNKKFLADVLELQEQIKQIDANGTVLSDICYAPLKDDDSVIESSDCVVQSIWGYFQDDITKLDDNDEDNGFNVSKANIVFTMINILIYFFLDF